MIIMKEKITFHTLVILLLANNKYTEFKVPKYWTYLVQTLIFHSQKKISVYVFFNYLRTISIKIDLTHLKFNKLIKIEKTSIYTTILKSNFYYQNYFPF